MQRFFDRPPSGDRGSALVDWVILLTGIILLAFSVIPAMTVQAEEISVDALDRVAAEEDWLPS